MTESTIIAGADGCRAGWLCITRDTAAGAVSAAVFPSAVQLIRQEPRPAVLTLDIPIGLPDTGSRACDLLARQAHEGHAVAGEAMVFTMPDGGWIAPHTFYKMWRRLQRRAGVPVVRLHDLHDLHVSLLVRHGLDPRAIADRVGHVDPAFTLRRYSHLFESQRRAAAVDLRTLLGHDEEEGDAEEEDDEAA